MKVEMFKKKVNLLSFIFSSLLFIFLPFLILELSNFSERHWTSFFDHELTITYNSLLFNSGIQQEYVDHSGYFSILLLSIFYQFLDLFNFINISNFKLFSEQGDININFQNLIIYTRVFAALSSSILLILTHFIYLYFSKNNYLAIILTILTFCSLGPIIHSIQLRTELISMIFFLMAFLALRFFFDKQKFFYFIFFLIFFYCSVLNKSQTFLYLPAMLILSKFNTLNLYEINTNNFKFFCNLYLKFFLMGIFFTYLTLKFFASPQKNILSPLFIISMILFINFFFYYHLQKSNISFEKYLLVINFSIILVYFVFKNILFIHPSTNEQAFVNTFTNIMSNTKYISGEIKILEFLFFNKYQFIILVFSLILSLIFRKKLGKNLFNFNILCIFIFMYISSIHLLRPNIYYSIFSDFFLILSFCSFGRYINFRNFYIPLVFATIFIYFQIPNIKNYLNTIKSNQIVKLCNDTYFYDWHKKIEKKKFNIFCENSVNKS